MLLKITEKCSMGCSHCVNDAKPTGGHMSFQTFEASIDFLIKNNAYHFITLSGGEPTEHPEFPMFIGFLIGKLAKQNLQSFITITTNGFWIIENEENLKCAKQIAAGTKGIKVQWQVSTDTRYYPKKLDITKRIWREEGFVLCTDCVQAMYPQGRAKTNNYPSDYKASHCFNVRAVTKQLPNPTVENVVATLAAQMKFCKPAIKIDGSIVLGESDLCPTCASIYDSSEEIIQKIKDFKCNGCYPLNESLPPLYKQFVE